MYAKKGICTSYDPFQRVYYLDFNASWIDRVYSMLDHIQVHESLKWLYRENCEIWLSRHLFGGVACIGSWDTGTLLSTEGIKFPHGL